MLISAMQLFWRKGYTATSIEDLVDALQLSRSSLYDTFGDKRTLFLEALKLYSAGVIRHIAQVLNEAPSALSGIQTIFDELTAGAGQEAGAMGCFMVNSIAELAPYDADVAAVATAYTETVERLITEMLTKAALQDTVTRKQTPEQLAVYVFNAMQGTRILIKSGATRDQLQPISIMVLDSLQR